MYNTRYNEQYFQLNNFNLVEQQNWNHQVFTRHTVSFLNVKQYHSTVYCIETTFFTIQYYAQRTINVSATKI